MRRIRDVLLCTSHGDGSQFLFIADADNNAYIYRAWNERKKQVTIPETIKYKGVVYRVKAVAWNAISINYRVINNHKIELMENSELT